MRLRIVLFLLGVCLGAGVPFAGAEAPWRFISLPDWHNAEKYVEVWRADYATYRAAMQAEDEALMANVRDAFGGELLIMPGDTQGGHWDASSFQNSFKSVPEYASFTIAEVIREAGHVCYSGMKEALFNVGYTHILGAIGDHEIGDNDWPSGSTVARQLPAFRQGYADIMNRDGDGNLLYTNRIGSADARPYGTEFEGTSYAVQIKNVLFITVDIFYQESPTTVIGPEGTVKGAMVGDHLTWFTNVLAQAAGIPSIKHIIVQSHLPGIYPVRKYASSGMLLAGNEQSDFFNAMRQYGVDLYLAGEVHANTATRDSSSDLVQLVTRGNVGTNPTVVDVEDDRIYVEIYKGQTNTTLLGTLEIDKSGTETLIAGTGVLELVDPQGLQIHFSFDQSVDEGNVVTSASNSRSVNTLCDRAFENDGGFGVDYVAFAKNCPIDPQGVVGGAVDVSSATEIGITSMGPIMDDYERTVACWVKSSSSARQIILDTSSKWNTQQFFNLALNNGQFEVILKNGILKRVNSPAVNDGLWHHVAVTLPWRGATVADLKLYVDGVEQADTTVESGSTVVDSTQSNWPVIGNLFAASRTDLAGLFGLVPFSGSLDEFCIWTRALSTAEIKAVYDGSANRGYDAVYLEALFKLYRAGAGTADVRGTSWTYDPSLTGEAGVFHQSGSTNMLVLGDQGGVMSVDAEPPTPNPAEFLLPPSAVSPVQVEMTAVTGVDGSGAVDYLFTEVSGNYGGTSSGWQSSSTYVDDGLLPDTTYAYTVTMRDQLGHTGNVGVAYAVTTPTVVLPRSAVIAAWHTPGKTAQGAGANDSSPDLVMDGISATLSGGRDAWDTFNSTDGSFGSLAAPLVPSSAANAIRVRTYSATENRIDLAVANNTGFALELDSFHFDFGGFDGGPLTAELIYLTGDLDDADNTSIATVTRTIGSDSTADYQDFDLPLSPALADVVLAAGESMTLQLLFSNAALDSNASGVDNIALLCRAENVDTDGDGIPDAIERQHQPILDPNNPADALLDEDEDGFSNLEEYLAGSDLSDPLDYLRVDLAFTNGTDCVVRFSPGRDGRIYILEEAAALDGHDWRSVDAIAPVGQALPFEFFRGATNSSCFYRIRAVLSP